MRKMLTNFKQSKTLHSLVLVMCLMVFPLMGTNQGLLKAADSPQQEPKTITGIVTDGTSGSGLPGVSIYVQGTSEGTTTNLDGEYSITALSTDVLVFSFVGYLTEEITVGDQTKIDIVLSEDIIGLDEVIVTGYGVQKKSDVTGSIASVSSEKLNEIPVAGVDQALQGLAAGVNVIPQSGVPGSSAVIQIRGISSINGIQPLIIVDGVPGSLDGISPNDIESIEILKDASSAAIYGDSGGNGVIIVTTKNGSSGKIKTSLNFYYGFESPVSRLDLMNSEQWLSTVEEATNSDTAITSRPDTFPNYDWQDILFGTGITQNYDFSTAGGNENSSFLLSASYNNQTGIIRNSDYERFTFRLNTEHKLTKRITVDNKLDYTNSKRFGFPLSVWNAYYDGPIRNGLTMQPNVPEYVDGYENMNDTIWGNSEFGGTSPIAGLDMVDRVARRNNFNLNTAVTIDLFKGLSFTSRFAGGMGFWDNKEFEDVYYNNVFDNRGIDEVRSSIGIGRDLNYNVQQLLNYNLNFSDHEISILAGTEASRNWDYNYSGERQLAPNTPEYLRYFSQSVNDTLISQIIEGGASENRALAILGRINYSYKGTYLFTANVRRSGRSSFGPDYRFGVFPSFSFGWKFTNESFMQNQNLLSFGKLRFGYGEVGTYARSNTPYLSIVRFPQTFAYPFDNMVSTSGAAPVQIPNSEIHWETIHMTNIGADVSFMQNKLSMTIEYYSKVNEDMLMFREVPYVAGSYSLGAAFDIDNTSPEVNIGSIKNSGLEFTLGYKNQIGDLKYNFDANLSTLKNEVLKLATDSLLRGGVHSVAPITLTRVGGSVSEFFGYETDGIFTLEDCLTDANGEYVVDRGGNYTVINQPFYIDENGETIYAQPKAQPGDVRYVDLNGDNMVLTDDDKTSLGSPLPKIIYGFSLNLEYKGFDFSAQFNGTIGNKLFNGSKQYLYYYQENTNHCTDFANRYVVNDIKKIDRATGQEVVVVAENRNTTVPRNNVANYAEASDFYIEDASYLRVRNITLGYTIPDKVTSIANIERLRLYVGGRNLFTFTSYTGINPEVADVNFSPASMGIDAAFYPVTKMLLFGANLNF
ncbi:MAG: TonB-dependent receptor [Bacteroidales bacterium]|nr:TonB-dependent receptor [Bacteroidales bacterium]MBN2821214.1 TonB-dependent receptor [Bacteroidales bacterium]